MPGFDGTGPPDGGLGWGMGPCGKGGGRSRGRRLRPRFGLRRARGAQRGRHGRDLAFSYPEKMPSPSLKETEQIERELAEFREEVADLKERLNEVENARR